MATPLEVIASELLKSAIDAEKLFGKTKDQSYKDKAVRLRRIVVNLQELTIGTSSVATLNDLTDVTISAAANGQVLTYNSTTSQWENQTPAAGGGGDMLKSTYDVDNDGIVDGSETVQIIVRNSTGTTLTKGTVVYLSGATGNRPNAVRAQANTEATSSKTIGIVIANIANNADGFVAVNGTLHNLDTSAFTAGDAVWLSAATAGAFTSTIPSEPNHTVFIGYIARAHPTQGRIVILIQNGYELNELHGVQIASEANNDLLVYETSTTLWKNKSISTIFGGTPLVSVPTLAQVTTAGNTTTNAITVGNINVGSTSIAASKITIESSSRSDIVLRSSGSLNDTFTIYAFGGAYGSSYAQFGTNDGVSSSAQGGAIYTDSRGGVPPIRFMVKGTGTTSMSNAMSIYTTTNVGIGTSTDAGYKLDVNGSIRSKFATGYNSTTTDGSIILTSSNDGNVALGVTTDLMLRVKLNPIGINFLSNGQQLIITGNRVYAFNNDGVLINSNITNTTSTTNGSLIINNTVNYVNLAHIYNAQTINPTITGLAGGVARGIYINPTLTAAADFRAIETTAGKVIIGGSITAASALARGVYFNNTLVAAANNDVLVGLDINPTFTNGAFTGVSNIGLRVKGDDISGGSGYSLYAYGGQAFIKGNWSITTGYNLIVQNRAGLDSLRVRGDGLTILEKLEVSDGNNKGFTVSYSGVGGYQFGLAVTDAGVAFTNGAAASRPVSFSMNTGEILRIHQNYTSIVTNNFLIGTTTDAGYKLDVNGTARISGQVDIAPGVSTLQITAVTQVNSRLIQFNTNGSTGGYTGGYEFRTGYNGSYGTATAFRIWSNSGTNNRIGIGDLSEANLQGGGAQVYINNQITGGRNAGVRISPAVFSTTQYNGIQFDIGNKDSNGGVFLGSQYNPLSNGYDVDLVVLTTSHAVSSYAETARFIGKYNSFYVGTDKTLAVASAKLQVESTTQGFLQPRMTNGQVLAITSPATGLQVYDTTNNKKLLYNGTLWQNIATESWVSSAGFTTGSGTTNYLPKFTGSSTLGNSQISDNGTSVTINATSGGIYLNSNIGFGWPVNINDQFKFFYGQLQANGNAYFTDYLLVGTTTNAGYKLDVNGTARVKTDLKIETGTGGLTIEGDASGYPTLLINTLRSGVDRRNWKFATEQVNVGDFIFYRSSTGGGAANTVVYAISKDGNFGLGTTTPAAKLQIKGTGDSSVWVTTDDFNSGTNTGSVIRIGTRSSTGNTQGWIDALNSGVSSYGNLIIAGFGGNVLIGTTTDAGYKLDVNGTARVGSLGLYGNNGTITAPLIKFNGSNQVNVDPQGYGTVTNHSLTTGNYIFASGGGIRANGGFGAKAGTSVVSTPFMSYGISRPDNDASVNALAGVGGVHDGATFWFQGLGLVFYTSNGPDISGGSYLTEKMRLSSVGNLGLGTNNPIYPLHISSAAAANIYGTVQSTNASGTAAWVAFNDQSDNVVYRVFGSGASGTQMGIALARSASLMANLGGSGKFLLGTYSNTDFVMGTGNAEKMRIVDSTGNVLIATTTDLGNKLEVSGSINSTGYKINNTAGYTGILNIVTNPPGQQNVDIQGGIIVNIF